MAYADLSAEQKAVKAAYQRTWYHKNKRRLYADEAWYAKKCRINAAYMQRMRERDPESLNARNRERSVFALCGKYGLTIDQYHALQERQDFLCAICHEDKPLHIDHCHSTGRVRGLLCKGCNSGIGMLRESPEIMARAANYVTTRWV
jgi:hypothetical protein